MATSSPVQQFIRATPVLPNPGPVQQFIRETPILPNPGPVTQLVRGTPFNDVGIRGPQIEPNDLTLDRLINATNAILETTPGIDLTTTGTQTIMTASQKTFVLGVLLRVSSADTVTSPASASVGVSPATDDVFADVTLVDLDQVNELYSFWSNTNTGAILNMSENLLLSVNTAATATTLQVTAHVIGFLP